MIFSNLFYNNILLINFFFNIFNLKIYQNIVLSNFFMLYLLIIIVMFFIANHNIFFIKKLSLFITIYAFFIFVYLYNFFNNLCLSYYFYYKISEILGLNFNIEYSIGVDSISYIFLFLTVFLFPVCLLISWNSVYYQAFFTI
jgi:NADH:ubiquinone oxidoreductase subunit 4 (subunit M)